MSVYAPGNQVSASATGASNFIALDEKPQGQDYTVFLSASAWGDTDVQMSHDGTNWGDAEELIEGVMTVVNRTKNCNFRCPGGVYLRLDVNSLSGSNPITLTAK
jgi:hypothetical protein